MHLLWRIYKNVVRSHPQVRISSSMVANKSMSSSESKLHADFARDRC